MRSLFLFICVVAAGNLFGQKTINVDENQSPLGPTSYFTAGGTPFANDRYVRIIQGTPYFSQHWMDGFVIATSGTAYKNLRIRLDMLANEVHYLDEKSRELIATIPVKEIILTDSLGTNYRLIHSDHMTEGSELKKGWYQWLYSGKVPLYKYYKKLLSESTPYGSSIVEQRIHTSEIFVVNYNGAYTEVKKLKDLPSALWDKKKQIEEFLKTKDNKNGSMEDRFLAVIEHYHSLLPAKK